MKSLLIMLLAPLVLTGCVKAISDQSLALIDRSVTYAAVQSSPDSNLGKHLLVGGRIITATSTNELSSMEIEQYKVDQDGVPFDINQSAGRFIAESTAFYDRTIYRPGNLVTMVGEVTGKRQQVSDGITRLYPVLTIKELYLWDPDKFGGRKIQRDENPYVSTHDQPLPERPLAPFNPRRQQ